MLTRYSFMMFVFILTSTFSTQIVSANYAKEVAASSRVMIGAAGAYYIIRGVVGLQKLIRGEQVADIAQKDRKFFDLMSGVIAIALIYFRNELFNSAHEAKLPVVAAFLCIMPVFMQILPRL